MILELDKLEAEGLFGSSLVARTGISKGQLSKWKKDRVRIFYLASLPKVMWNYKFRETPSHWPTVELKLFLRVCWRKLGCGKRVSRKWLSKTFLRIWGKEPAKVKEKVCEGSNGLISNFCRRWGLTSQVRSNKKDESLEERLPRIRAFHQSLIYGLQRSNPQRCTKYGRFPPELVFHMDQVPLPFSRTNAKSMNFKGRKYNRICASGGSDKRECTLQLTIRAKGKQIVLPELIFAGQGIGIEDEELEFYRKLPNLVIRWQKKAWADEKIALEYLETFRDSTKDLDEVLLGADNLASQSTPGCRMFMKLMSIFPCWTPTECTDCVSPVDSNVGAWFQLFLKQKWDAFIDQDVDLGIDVDVDDMQHLATSKRRMLIAQWVSDAWDELNDPERDLLSTLVWPAFVETGFCLAKDGSENSKVKLDGWNEEQGNYDF
jgi:hypothetical protein